MAKKDKEFESIDIFEVFYRYWHGRKKKKKEDFHYWCDWIKDYVLEPPLRDDIVKYNIFLNDISSIFKKFDTTQFGPEILDDVDKCFEEFRFNEKIMTAIGKANRKKYLTDKGGFHILLLIYLYTVESTIKSLISVLIKVKIYQDNKYVIKSKRNVRSGDFWEFKDTSLDIPRTTIMELKGINEIKEITEISQISDLFIREIANSFKQNGYNATTDTINKLCNYNLRNQIAHGKYEINPYKKSILFADGSTMNLKQFMKEMQKLSLLARLIITGIYLSFIIIDHKWDVKGYRKEF